MNKSEYERCHNNESVIIARIVGSNSPKKCELLGPPTCSYLVSTVEWGDTGVLFTGLMISYNYVRQNDLGNKALYIGNTIYH